MQSFTIYHNPRCSKSRDTLALLAEHGIAPAVVEYLSTPPDLALLRELQAKLGVPVRAMLRNKEAEYAELGLADPALSDEALLAALAAHPKLLERPIVVSGERAVFGRPPENVLALISPV